MHGHIEIAHLVEEMIHIIAMLHEAGILDVAVEMVIERVAGHH